MNNYLRYLLVLMLYKQIDLVKIITNKNKRKGIMKGTTSSRESISKPEVDNKCTRKLLPLPSLDTKDLQYSDESDWSEDECVASPIEVKKNVLQTPY